jgi:RNA polymerase sigma-B factor
MAESAMETMMSTGGTCIGEHRATRRRARSSSGEHSRMASSARAALYWGASPLPVGTVHERYWQSRDPELEAELMRRHEPLAIQLAKSFSHRGEPLDDLCQVARLALLRALRNYDPHRSSQFSTYAVPTIVGALKRHFRDRGWLVRPPRRVQEGYLTVSKAIEDLGSELGRHPTVAEIAHRTGLGRVDVVASLQAKGGRRAVSLDAPPTGQDAACADALSDQGAHVERTDDWLLMAELVRLLPKAEREVVNLWVFGGLTQSEIATVLGTSQSSVSRVRRRALDHLRALHGDGATAA